jgi:hypothetical protein
MKLIPSRARGVRLAVALVGTVSVASVAFALSPASASAVTATYSCSASTPVGPVTYSGPADFAGTTPTKVAPGAAVSLTKFQATMTIPGSLLDEAYSYGVRTISAKVTAFDVNATDATPGTVDAPKKPVNVGKVTLKPSDNPPIDVKIPLKAATIKGWVASTAGTMAFSPGAATFDLKSNLGSLSAQCSPTSPVPSISSTTVS